MPRLVGWAMALVALAGIARADEFTVLPPDPPPGDLLYRWLQTQANQAIQRRVADYEQIESRQQALAWQRQRREIMLRQIGGLPERTPLDARVTGTLTGDGYRVEKIVFASQPNHHVTGVLYLPDTPPPYPGVIVPCGHSTNGKAYDTNQRAAILLAKNGLAAFCYDPVGQGERHQTFRADGSPYNHPLKPDGGAGLLGMPADPRFNPVEEHTLMGVGAILVGYNTARYRIWDGIRALDYLASRDDIDAARLGCTGNSGGGTLTAYLMALDERIQAAASVCYLTSFERLLATSGPQDAEQNIFAQLSLGLDQHDYVLMRAPRATLICNGTRDATFDIVGAWEVFRQGKRFFARLDHPERVDMVETDYRHGFSIQLREGATRWMRRWLLDRNDAVSEREFPIWSDQDLQCAPQGQVMLLPGERSVFDMNVERQRELAAQRKSFWQSNTLAAARPTIRQLAGIRPFEELPPPKIRQVGVVKRAGYRIEKWLIEAEAGLPIPALACLPDTITGDAIVYVHDQGKQVAAQPDGELEQLVRAGHWVLAIDPRGTGETRSSTRRDWGRALFGENNQEFWVAYLLGKSLVGMRAEDILTAAQVAASRQAPASGKSVRLIADGQIGIAALHAAAVEPELIRQITLRRTAGSWADVVAARTPYNQLTHTVHGALAVYDLPDLVRALGPERVTVRDPAAVDAWPALP